MKEKKITKSELERLTKYVEAKRDLIGSANFTVSVLMDDLTGMVQILDVPFSVFESLRKTYC